MPGNAGYLQCYADDMSGNKTETNGNKKLLFIKNISYNGIPKFVLTVVDDVKRAEVGKLIGIYEDDLHKTSFKISKNKPSNTTNKLKLLRIEGFYNKYISFE